MGGDGEDGTALDTVERFDPRNNMWMLVSSMTEKRLGFCGVAFKKDIFVFGSARFAYAHSAEVYDID